MGHAAVKLSRPTLYLVEGEVIQARSRTREKVSTQNIAYLCSCLAILQIFDGLFTGIGIHHFGVSAEGNFILRALMHAMGYIPALLLTKTFALAVIFGIFRLSDRVRWIATALKSLIALYLLAAVIPWTWILLTR